MMTAASTAVRQRRVPSPRFSAGRGHRLRSKSSRAEFRNCIIVVASGPLHTSGWSVFATFRFAALIAFRVIGLGSPRTCATISLRPPRSGDFFSSSARFRQRCSAARAVRVASSAASTSSRSSAQQQQAARGCAARVWLPHPRRAHLDAVPVLRGYRTGAAPTHTYLRRLEVPRWADPQPVIPPSPPDPPGIRRVSPFAPRLRTSR